VWKKNVLEDLEERALEYELVGEFLAAIKKEFGGGEKKLVKVAELKELEQEGRMIEDLFKNLRERRERADMKGDCWWKSSREK